MMTAEVADPKTPAPTVAQIQATVAAAFGLPPAMIRGKNREHRAVVARQVAMYLAVELVDLSSPAIGRLFRHHHATVLHSWRVVAIRRDEDPEFAAGLERIEQALATAPQHDRTGVTVQQARDEARELLARAAQRNPKKVLSALNLVVNQLPGETDHA